MGMLINCQLFPFPPFCDIFQVRPFCTQACGQCKEQASCTGIKDLCDIIRGVCGTLGCLCL
uniref:ShKT domain-containing protein n=1 Tax=Meloidogyne incognita TaxID=6306 RepID=A0A914MRB4_MELIC